MDFISKTGSQSALYDIAGIKESKEWLVWMDNKEYLPLCLTICQLNDLYCIGESVDPSTGIQFYTKGTSSALVLDGILLKKEFSFMQFFQLYLTERLANAGYIIQLRETKRTATTETHWIIYLKPSYSLPAVNGRGNQLFGNLHLNVKTDDTGLKAKLQITIHQYTDYQFNTGSPFADLIRLLCCEA